MKNIAYSIVALSFGLLFSSCEKKFDREVFPHSTPVVESAKITSVKDSNSSSVIYGDSIELTALVTDTETPLSTLDFQLITSDNILIFTNSEIIRGRSDEVTVRYKIPFLANMDSQMLQAQLVTKNSEGDVTYYQIPESNNLYFNRPTFGDNLYVVTETNTVIKLTKSKEDENQYSASGLNLENAEFRYKVAEKLDAEGNIDYSSFVWGNSNDVSSIIDSTGTSFSFDNTYTIITGFNFNTYSFADSIYRKDKPLLVNNVQLVKGTYDGYLSAKIQFAQNQDVEFVGFVNLENSLNPSFFTYESALKAKFTGLSGEYTVHYNTSTKFLYIEQADATSPNGLWICGTGLGFPQQTYTATTAWSWDITSNYIFCRKVSDNLFEATFYAAADFDIKFFDQRGWGGEQKSADYSTKTSNLWYSTIDGNWKANANFAAGVYKVSIDIVDKTANLEKLN